MVLSSIRAKNALSPLMKLPVEVLTLVFLALKLVWRAERNRHPDRLGWIAITHVCDHLRNVRLFLFQWS